MQLKNNLYKIIRKEGVGPVVNYAIELIPSCVIYAAGERSMCGEGVP